MPPERAPASGFTFVEMLITLTLMVVVAGVLTGVISGGYRVWARTAAYGTEEQASIVAFEQLRHDLQGLRPFALVPFRGSYDGFTAAAAGRRAGSNLKAPKEVGRLAYQLRDREGVLCRSFIPYRLSERIGKRDQCEVALQGVQRIRFEYFGAARPGEPGRWSSSWDADTLPTAVKVSVELARDGRAPVAKSFVGFLASRPQPPAEGS